MSNAFLGMRGTGDWGTDVRPQNYRQGMLFLFPNGNMPLTALSSMGRNESTDDPTYHYWQKNFEAQGGAFTITEVYSDSSLDTKVTGAATSGQTLHVKVTDVIASNFIPNQTVVLVSSADATLTVFGKVTAVDATNGINSRVTFKTKIASTALIQNMNYLDITGTANPEGGTRPTAVSYNPQKFFNHTQIFRNSLEITRTQNQTKLRTGDGKAELERETLQYHGVEIENAMLTGERSEEISGTNQKFERTSQGGVSFLKEHASGNVLDWVDTGSTTWAVGGEEFLDDSLQTIFKFGRDTKLALCGDGALSAINKLVKASTQFNITETSIGYGVQVVRWTTPFGVILLKRHPLFTHKTYRTNDLFILEPENLTIRTIQDTIKKVADNETGIDGDNEEFLTEIGFQWEFPETMGYFSRLGLDAT